MSTNFFCIRLSVKLRLPNLKTMKSDNLHTRSKSNDMNDYINKTYQLIACAAMLRQKHEKVCRKHSHHQPTLGKCTNSLGCRFFFSSYLAPTHILPNHCPLTASTIQVFACHLVRAHLFHNFLRDCGTNRSLRFRRNIVWTYETIFASFSTRSLSWTAWSSYSKYFLHGTAVVFRCFWCTWHPIHRTEASLLGRVFWRLLITAIDLFVLYTDFLDLNWFHITMIGRLNSLI